MDRTPSPSRPQKSSVRTYRWESRGASVGLVLLAITRLGLLLVELSHMATIHHATSKGHEASLLPPPVYWYRLHTPLASILAD